MKRDAHQFITSLLSQMQSSFVNDVNVDIVENKKLDTLKKVIQKAK